MSGTRLNALWLAEQNGRSFLDLWDEGDRRNVAAALLMVIDVATPVVAGAESCTAGIPPLDLELLLLPLRHFGKTHSRMLGSLTPVSQPDWFGRAPANALKLTSLRIIGADEKIVFNPLVPRASASRNVTSRPRLVIYEGGKAK
jgi:hypothetical protein